MLNRTSDVGNSCKITRRLESNGSERSVSSPGHFEIEASRANLILTSVGDGIYGVDANGITTFFNPAAEIITGWKAEEVIGKSSHLLLHHSYPDGTPFPVHDCPIYKALQDGLVHRSDQEIFWRKDGTGFAVEFTSSPLIPNEGSAGVIVIFQDISERKRRELAETQASQAKSDFLSNMSHEIRTPMNGVLGTIQLLLSTDLSPEQRRYAEIAQSSGSVLISLIDDILDLSKIEAGKVVIEKLNFNLSRTLADVVDMWSIQSRLKGLVLVLQMGNEVPLNLCGDAGRLRQILNNLISNAVKFTDEGSITLNVQALGIEGQSVRIGFSLVDTGIGMTPDQSAKLFQPFVQADSSTTRKYGGTGLGLAISKRLVELLGGTIRVESQEGHGTVFSFSVVLGVVAVQPLTSCGLPSGAEQQALLGKIVQRSSKRVLVAEDNATNQLVILAQLEKLGYLADVVTNGANAVQAAQTGRYDLILMDCEMPIMDGYEATRRIRTQERKRIPIVALTAHAMAGHREACLVAGMDFHLSKPIDMQRLARALDMWCRTTTGAPENTPVSVETIIAEPQLETFDVKAFLERLMQDKQLATVIVHAFVDDCPLQLKKLRNEMAANDSTGVRLQAHTLKGSAATISASRLAGIASAIEETSDQLEHCRDLLPKAEEAFEALTRVLRHNGWLQSSV